MKNQAIDQQDSAGGRPVLRHGWRIVVLALLIFGLTLAVYHRDSTGWYAQGAFNIDATRTVTGIPGWLVHNSIEATGSAPAIDPRILPGAEGYQAGFHIRLLPLSIVVLATSVVAAVVYAIYLAINRITRRELMPREMVLSYGILILFTALLGALTVAVVNSMGILLVFVLGPLTILLFAAWSRQYFHAVAGTFLAVVCLWWGTRMADHLLTKPRVHELPGQEELGTLAFVFGAMLIVALCGKLLGDYFPRRSRQATTPPT